MFYGPIHNAPFVFPAAAVDGMMAYADRFTGVRPVTDDHPLYRVF